jgi:hypothetical protein
MSWHKKTELANHCGSVFLYAIPWTVNFFGAAAAVMAQKYHTAAPTIPPTAFNVQNGR